MFYINSGLIGGAKLLETAFNASHNVGVLITLVAVTSYTFIGGFMAVSRTDVFQALIMLVSFIALPLTLIVVIDNPFRGIGEEGFLNPLTDAGGMSITLVFLISTVGRGLGAFGSQRVLQRFMSLESEDKVKPSRNIGTIWLILIFSFGFLMGLMARPAMEEMGLIGSLAGDDGLYDSERVYFVLSEAFFIPILTGLLLTGVVAAIMSTADSQLLLGSAIATDDAPFVKGLAQRIESAHFFGASGKVWLGRLMLLLIGGVAGGSAMLARNSISSLVAYAWGGVGAAFGPVTILALYWRRFNIWGATASILAGAATVTIWHFTSGGPWGMFDMEISTVPGFIAALTAGYIASILTAPPSDAIRAQFDRVNAGPVNDPEPAAAPA